MNIDHFRCAVCGGAVGPREVRQPLFRCPGCGACYRSNYRQAMRWSLLLTLALWLGVTLVAALLSEAWPRVLLLSLELGLISSLFLGMLIHRLLLRVRPER
ncbi:MAG: hypothetical protein KDI68_00335 [Gammaproteobacteria bacterium]|nr:hypothetical protein [Gammaproteobacteria bacterium]